MKYRVNYSNPFLRDYNVQEFDNPEQVAEYITDHMNDDVYDEMLDECYEPINICGIEYSPSVALYRVDEVAYKSGRNDYYDSLQQDIIYDIERMDDEEETEFYDFTVTAIDEESEDEEDEE